jgi:hypothetical protein
VSDNQVSAQFEIAAAADAGGLPHSAFEFSILSTLAPGTFTTSPLVLLIERANEVPANSGIVYININSNFGSNSAIPAINLQPGNTLIIRGTNTEVTQPAIQNIQGYGNLRGIFVQSGNVEIQDVVMKDFISFGGDGGNPGGDGGAMIQIEENY